MARYESDPALQELVSSYDDYGIVLNTVHTTPVPGTSTSEPESEWSKKARIGTRKHKK